MSETSSGMGFSVIAVSDYAAAKPALRAVREAVFVREQNVPAELELDAERDPLCVHVLALDESGTPIVGALVRASWFRATGDANRAITVNRSLTVESGSRGLFALCDLPSGWQARVEVLGERDEVLASFQLRSSREAVWVDLRKP